MKLGIAMSTYPTKFGPITFNEGTTEEKLKQISSIGYTGVDLFSHDMTASERTVLKQLLSQYNVEISMYIPFFLAELKLSFTNMNDKERNYFLGKYKDQISIAAQLGAKTMPLGFIRGNLLPNDTFNAYKERLADSLADISAHAVKMGVVLCLEPINSNEINTFYHACEAYDFLVEFKLDNVNLLLDSYHNDYEYKTQSEIIDYCKDRISHYHISDTKRTMAGEGLVDFKTIFESLHKIGYSGYASIESEAKENAHDVALKSYNFLNTILKGL